MEEPKPQDAHRQTLLYLVAGLALVFVIFAGYTVMQLNAISQQRSAAGNNTELLNRLDSLESRLAVLEATSDVKPATLMLFYDSSCEFCENDNVLSYFDGYASNFANWRISLQKVDIKGQGATATSYGVARVPALYASSTDVMNNKYLEAYLTQVLSSSTSGFSVAHPPNGNVIYVPQRSETVAAACSEQNATKLDYFYSESCTACKRLRNAQGLEVNPKGPGYEYVASEGLAEAKARFGSLLSVENRCVALHTGDEQLCLDAVGDVNYTNAESKLAEYALDAIPVTVPTFVVDCKYVFSNLPSPSGNAIEKEICAARPDVCSKLPANASPTATATPSVNATATPSASPAA
ncbi:MAG: hypothetical protein V1881_02815 [Candidatus Micrarchaeota archaeon]